MLSATLTALLRNPEAPQWAIRDAIQEEEPTVAEVHIIQGDTGEYSDRHDWLVAAFVDRGAAEARLAAINGWVAENKLGRGSFAPDVEDHYSLKCPFDPAFSCDYTGVRYRILLLKLEG